MEDAYSVLATRHKYPHSARYRRLLEFLLTPLQARLAVELPGTAEEMAQRLGLALPEVTGELDSLFHRGIIYPKEGSDQFKIWGSADVLFYSLCAYNPNSAEGRQAVELWTDFFHHEWSAQIVQTLTEKKMPEERVLPAYKAVQNCPDLHPCEDVREIMKAAQDIAVVDCPCRLMLRKCHSSLDTCFMLGRMAEITLSQGFARRLTFDQAMALMDKAEEEGQVHTWINSSFMHHRFLCNCCNDCCTFWVPLAERSLSMGQRLAKSRFQAALDLEKCRGDCPVCVERCLFQAIEIKQLPGGDTPKAVIDAEKCWGCGLCVLKCEPRALSMQLVRPLEHIPGLAAL